MARWRARIEFDAAMSDKQANQAARRMALHAGTVIPDEARRRVEVVLDTEAGTLRQAVTLALRTARAALAEADVAGAPLAVHATTLAGRQVDVSQPLRTELISPAEIGKILGVPKAKLREITMRPDFPPPWSESEVGPSTPGRRSTPSTRAGTAGTGHRAELMPTWPPSWHTSRRASQGPSSRNYGCGTTTNAARTSPGTRNPRRPTRSLG